MMNLVYNIVFLITAVIVILYDYKIQKIPIWIIILNYISFCLLINPFLLFGLIGICILKYLDKPVDIVYIILIGFILLNTSNLWYALSIIPMLIQTIFSKKEKISLMVSIEIACIILLLAKIILK
jgi:hypothetical protein